MRHKRNWFSQWNYNAPLIWFCDWFKAHHKKLFRFITKKSLFILAVVIGFELSEIAPNTISSVIAYHEDQEIKKQKEIEQMQLDAIRKEEVIKKSIEEKQRKLLYDEEQKKQAEINRLNEIEEEIKSEFGIGDRIIITWWGDFGTGPDTPKGYSATGRIKKIKGEYIYGTWGDEPLKYNNCYWHRCDAKEMKEVLKQERDTELRLAKIKAKKSRWVETMTADEKKIYQRMGIVKNLVK